MYHTANFYTTQTKARFEQLTGVQRELVVAFVSPNGEPLTDEGLAMFFSLMDEGTIAFAQPGTANEHLHVPHPPNQHRLWCMTCAVTELAMSA